MRHLVTGATGYVGGRLAPRLLAEGDAVRCLARDPAKLRDVPWARDAEIVRGDLLDEDAVRRACVGVDCVYFLVHSLVDFPLRTAAIGVSFAMCIALLADRRAPLASVKSDLRPTRHIVLK